eukprot:552967_1
MIILWVFCTTYLYSSLAYLNNKEINALTDIYNAWNGPFWTECAWSMTLINDTNTYNFIIDQCGLYFGNHSTQNYQFVDKIDFYGLKNTNITGTIPSSIGNLSYLTWFRSFYNDLYGMIPSEFCNIHSLQHFDIYGNDFNGLIPECLFNLSQITAIALDDIPTISITSRMIDILCNNYNITDRFNWLQLRNIHYIGSIPECIGYKLKNMIYLAFDSLPSLNGTIPSSINNFINIEYLLLSNLSSLSGTTTINISKLYHLSWITLDLTIIYFNVSDLCKLNLAHVVLFNKNEDHLVSLPTKCIFQNNRLYEFSIYGAGFKGSIDESLCSQNTSLQSLVIENTKFMNIHIPSCLSTFNPLTSIVLINNTNLRGSLPEPALNSSLLQIVKIQNNKHLTGNIENLLTVQSMQYLEFLALDNNNFVDQNMEKFIKLLFKEAENLQLLTLHNNKYLSGAFPHFSDNIYLDNLQVLTMHNLDIYGTISNKLYLSRNVTMNDSILFTLFGNRLSGHIPSELFGIKAENKEFKPIILTGNKFTIYTEEKQNSWFGTNSVFMDAAKLHITRSDNVIADIMGCSSFIFIAIYLFALYYKCKNKKDIKIDYGYLFLYNLQTVNELLLDPILILLVLISVIFWYLNSNYYLEITLIAQMSTFNFYSTSIAYNILFVVIIASFNILMIHKVFQINDTKHKFEYDKRVRLTHSIDANDNIYDISVPAMNTSHEKWWLYLSTFIWIIIYICVLTLVCFHGLFVSLPDNNIFNIESYYTLKTITVSIAFILALTKSFIIPKMTVGIFKIFGISFKHRN